MKTFKLTRSWTNAEGDQKQVKELESMSQLMKELRENLECNDLKGVKYSIEIQKNVTDKCLGRAKR